MINPLVSIIIPVYNRGHFIAETLQSIYNQSYSNWECIIVDDHSIDNTKLVVEGFCKTDKRFKYLIRPDDLIKGANSCRNYGFAKTNGDYVQWFDSDDLMYSRLLQEKIEALELNKSLNFCVCQMDFFIDKDNSRKITRTSNIKHNKLFEDYISGKIEIGTQTVLWRRQILLKESLFDEHITQSQDLEFNSRLFFKHKKGAVINKALIGYRIAEDSISSDYLKNIEKHYKSFLEVRRRIINYDKNNLIVNEAVIKSVLTVLRSGLAIKNYAISDEAIEFINKNNNDKSLHFKWGLLKIKTAYFIIKNLKFGETRFKKYFKI